MEQFLSMMQSWHPFGQFIFGIMVVGAAAYTVCYVVYCITALVAGKDPKPPTLNG